MRDLVFCTDWLNAGTQINLEHKLWGLELFFNKSKFSLKILQMKYNCKVIFCFRDDGTIYTTRKPRGSDNDAIKAIGAKNIIEAASMTGLYDIKTLILAKRHYGC